MFFLFLIFYFLSFGQTLLDNAFCCYVIVVSQRCYVMLHARDALSNSRAQGNEDDMDMPGDVPGDRAR